MTRIVGPRFPDPFARKSRSRVRLPAPTAASAAAASRASEQSSGRAAEQRVSVIVAAVEAVVVRRLRLVLGLAAG